ncbi:hypothetical protein Tco_0243537, partial [Tanacetum coccineum]
MELNPLLDLRGRKRDHERIAVSMEYPMRPPFFTLNLFKTAATETELGDKSDEWLNEIRAIEVE